jgi:predicted secreted protein
MATMIRPKWLVLGMLLSSCVWLFSATEAQAEKKKEKPTEEAILVTEKDDGKTVELPEKTHLLASLHFNAGTGFQWKLKEQGKELVLVSHLVVKPLDAAPIGGTRLAAYQFRPNGSGACVLEFDLVGPDGKEGKVVKLTVNVGKAK